jgi:transposase
MKIIPIEKKLAIVLSIKDGTPIKVASRNHGVQSKQARAWYRRYTRYGCSGLETKTGSRRFDADFKLHVVLSVLEKSVSLAKAAVIYDIDVNTLRRWREQYLSGKEMPQPASCTKKVKPMGRPRKKQPQTELEVLQAENERLRAEVALLKKVQALVEERERRERKSGRWPSKN